MKLRLGMVWVLLGCVGWGQAGQKTLEKALGGTGASAVVVDVASGRVVAQVGKGVAAAPGSVLKPFVLLAGLKAGGVGERTAIECRGTLRVRGRNLACTHPRSTTVFTAREALAYSCNTYFARLAERMTAPDLVRGLGEFGIRGSVVGNDADGRILLALGLAGVRVSPEELGRAYAGLGRRLGEVPVVRDGLIDSVRFGMADNASVPGLVVAGKTGTASDSGVAWTHGWFAGIVSGEVLVVYVPQGSGADAASLARRVLVEWKR